MEQTTDQGGAIVFDTSSGISLEEQQEILDGINAMSEASFRGNGLTPETAAIKPKKKGFLFPLLVNIGAVIILASGFYLLSIFHGQDEQEIRNNSAGLGLTESKLIQEIRRGTSPAAEELMLLNDERERAARIESLVGGFFTRVKNQIEEGRLNEAAATLLEMKDFLNAPLFAGVRSLEAGRQSYFTAIDALERAVFDAIRLREEASASGGLVLGEALDELNARYAALEQESAALSAQGSDQNIAIADRDLRIRQLETANASQQETLNRRDSEIVSLRNERDERVQQLNSLSANLAEQISQREELQRQYSDLQQRLDAALRLFQGE